MSEEWRFFKGHVLNAIAGNKEARGKATLLCRDIITRCGYRHLDSTIQATVDDDDLWASVNVKIEQSWHRFAGKTVGAFYCWVRTILNSVRRNLEDRYVPKRERDPDGERRKDDAAVQFLFEAMASDEPTPDQVAEALEREYLVQRALKVLPLEERAVVQMSMDGMTHEEIADMLGESRSAVRSRWRSARNRLRAELRACA